MCIFDPQFGYVPLFGMNSDWEFDMHPVWCAFLIHNSDVYPHRMLIPMITIVHWIIEDWWLMLNVPWLKPHGAGSAGSASRDQAGPPPWPWALSHEQLTIHNRLIKRAIIMNSFSSPWKPRVRSSGCLHRFCHQKYMLRWESDNYFLYGTATCSFS